MNFYANREVLYIMVTNVRKEIEKFEWKVRYVPHEIIEDYNACYKVVYHDKVIYPPAANKLGIPLNEIWLSERLREYEDYVLFHELREIQYRYQGYNVREAHLKAKIDEALRFCRDSKWMEYFEKFPDSSVPLDCLKELCGIIKSNIRSADTLYKLLIKCITHHGKA